MIRKLFKSKVMLTEHELDIKIRRTKTRIFIFAAFMILCFVRLLIGINSRQDVNLLLIFAALIALEIIYGTNYFKRVKLIDQQK